MDNLAPIIPDRVKNNISNVQIHLDPHLQDVLVWKGNVNWDYTTKSGFSWLLSRRESSANERIWASIWRLRAPENFKFLCGFVAHDSIPTIKLLSHKGVLSTATYQHCHMVEESFLHVVRHCIFSKYIWHTFGFNEPQFMLEMDQVKWVHDGASGEKEPLLIAFMGLFFLAFISVCLLSKLLYGFGGIPLVCGLLFSTWMEVDWVILVKQVLVVYCGMLMVPGFLVLLGR